MPKNNHLENIIPPYSIDYENTYLGMVLINPSILNSENTLEVDDFFYQPHREIYGCMLELKNDGDEIDIVSVSELLNVYGKLESVGGRAYLNDMALDCMSSANHPYYTKHIKEYSQKRKVVKLTNDIACVASDKQQDLQIVTNKIKVIEDEISKLYTIDEPYVDSLWYAYDALEKRREKKDTNILSYINGLDDIVGTFLPGDLILIAARPSMGKTYLTLELSRNMVRNSLNVVFFSIEMTKQKIIYRQLARETKINSRKFRTSSFTDDELENVSKAISNICFQKMIIDDKSKTTPAYVRNKIISENKKRKVDAVFIDYFGLMKPDREYSDKYHEASSISEGIKTLTKDLDIPVFCVCQLNRECEKRQDKRPMLSDLRESGSLEQDADIVLFLHRDSYYNRHKGEPDDGDTEIIVAKNRDGQLGIVKTKMIPEWGEFKEL